MNIIACHTRALSGATLVPSSKSQSIRALFMALLATGESTLSHLLDSDDTHEALQVCQQLGASIKQAGQQLTLNSTGIPLLTKQDTIHTGNSGITTRFILPILGLCHLPKRGVIVDCGEQMRARPIASLVDALNQLGLNIGYLKQPGKLPLSITGQLRGGNATVSGMTSQFISALLIALPCAAETSTITVTELNERPYLDMTLAWLQKQGIHYTHVRQDQQDHFTITGKQHYQPFNTVIHGDYSSASYILAAAALLPGSVTLHGLDLDDPQGDKRLISILQMMGANIQLSSSAITIQGGKPLKGITIDANDIPDLVPTLAVLGTQASGRTQIHHVAQARLKETDRIHSMTEGLIRLGCRIEEQADGMVVYPSTLIGTHVAGYDDHRTVMALSIAGLIAKGTTTISDGQAINKTFPHFVSLMQSLGAKLEKYDSTL